MKLATISEAKNRLSALIDQVKSGETVLITDRGRPVARLQAAGAGPDPSGRLERLERAGAIRRALRPLPEEILEVAPPPCSASILEALLEERSSGR